MRSISINSRMLSQFRFGELSPTLQFRLFSSGNDDGSNKNNSSFGSSDYFDRNFFGDSSGSTNNSSFFQKLDKIEKAHDQSIDDFKDNDYGNSRFTNDQRAGFDTLSDGMDWKLKKAANYFEFTDEVLQDDYHFRPDMVFWPGTTYTTKDLDLTKPAIPKPAKGAEFTTTTDEVMKKADFRNVRFLSNFLTEAGIIIKRSQTKIKAKAQRRVAREIKTARAFGLMPFTTMGTKPFSFGKNMEDTEGRFEDDM